MSAIVVTFVFSVYLTGTVGQGTPGDVPPASWLGRALAIAGVTIAAAGAADRCVGGEPAPAAYRPDRADRHGGGADVRDEPDP